MEKTVKNKNFVFGLGRRKEASAEVRIYTASAKWGEIDVEKGQILVNKVKAEEYFGKNKDVVYTQPLRLTNSLGKFAITVRVKGGGKDGQLKAMVLGISRALNLLDKDKHRLVLKKEGLLTRDPRVRERRKVGMGGKSRRRKQSPKR